jgi:hypothetical protein
VSVPQSDYEMGQTSTVFSFYFPSVLFVAWCRSWVPWIFA